MGWIIVNPSLSTFSLRNVRIQMLTFSGNTPKGTEVTFYQLSGAFFIPVEMTHKINCYCVTGALRGNQNEKKNVHATVVE